MLARTNQALGTLETYRQRLDQGLTRLTALEFQGAVTLDDVLVVIQRAEMTTRMAEEIERNCIELGEEGRLIRMQLDELMEHVPREKAALVFDYEADPGRAPAILEQLSELPHQRLLDLEELTALLGHDRDDEPARPQRSRRAATAFSHSSHASRTASSATSCATSARSTRSSARATAISRRSTGSARCARATSGRG